MKKLKNKKKLKKVIIIIGIVAFIAIIGYLVKGKGTSIEVEAYEVNEGTIEKYVEELGTVMVNQQATVYANLSGKVIEVLIDVGDEVKKGDILVRIDSEDQERDVRILEAQKIETKAKYNDVQKPVDGTQIKKLELVLSGLEKDIEASKINLNNQKELLDQGIISDQEYKDLQLNYEAEQREVEKARLDLELLRKPTSSNILKQIEAQLLQLDLQIEALKSNAGDFVFTAPFDGTIFMKNIDAGSYIQQGTAIIEMGYLGELYIESDILVEDIGDINVGSTVKIENSNLGIKDVKGIVTKIYPLAVSKISDLGVEQKRIKTEIKIEDSLQSLRPGYDLDVKIIVDRKEKVLLIPENAIFEIAGKDYVFVIEEGVANLREIEKGLESERQVEVISGLIALEKIILSPVEQLEEGIMVKERNFDK
ncbi:MAG: efflux transporter periplasmic adaptor subunit [Firmicutes bacterium HGW-Firmicutes-7]|nr:MAG: efflux transporter periplasmic adaptor subunit [Firmicutes bacterium HGW-Firmicutes-7]